MRLIEIVADAGHSDTLAGIADQHEITDYWWGAEAEDGRRAFRMLVDDAARQPVIDAVQSILSASDNVRIVVMPVEAVLPRETEEETSRSGSTREELYSRIEKGARVDGNYLLLAFLSTVVAAVGLIEDNVAVVIGAMVIAPFLGPVIALAFGSSMGDTRLMTAAARSGLAGMGLAFLVSLVIGSFWPVDIASGTMLVASTEIIARTDVGMDGVVLALAAGAAGVLSLSTGLSGTLVGVMVAVALLPPTATMGLLLGAGHFQLAGGAGLLLAVNIVCVIVAAKLVFVARGIGPRTVSARQKARRPVTLFGLVWIMIMLALLGLMLVRQQGFG